MTRKSISIFLFSVLILSGIFGETPEEWESIAMDELNEALKVQPNTARAKNVLFFLGDGMGISTMTAGRIYKGQLAGKSGEEGALTFEKFPHLGLSKTYNDNFQTPDSAGTATAYFCGQKAAMGVIGVNSHAKLDNCKSSIGNAISSILDWAQNSGKSTGIITTTRITHATPAATYAHSPSRDWESDSDVPVEDRNDCEDIAKQLIKGKVGRNLKVILGGGRQMFLPKGVDGGLRSDGLDLMKTWKEQKVNLGMGKYAHLIRTRQELEALDPATTDSVFGLFSSNHMEYELRRNRTAPNQPSLKEMVRKAIQILQKDSNGFHLVVEGGKIDHAHHDGTARLALHEVVAFDEAIEMALSMVPADESLYVVTADHSHTLSIVGYPERGNSILKFGASPGADDLPYTTLSYANGPGAITSHPRRNLSTLNTEHEDFQQDALVPLKLESHSGEDVAIYAKGPWAHLFHSLHEQHYIPHVIDYAACYRKKSGPHCQRRFGMKEERESRNLKESAGKNKYGFLENHHL